MTDKPAWWNLIRQVVIFALGCALIIDVAVNPAGRVVLIVTGLILIGLVPVDTYLTRNGKEKEARCQHNADEFVTEKSTNSEKT